MIRIQSIYLINCLMSSNSICIWYLHVCGHVLAFCMYKTHGTMRALLPGYHLIHLVSSKEPISVAYGTLRIIQNPYSNSY
jgi:hypothetical protein